MHNLPDTTMPDLKTPRGPGELMGESVAGKDLLLGVPSLEPRPDPSPARCVSCVYLYPLRDMFFSACGHSFCQVCMRQIFLGPLEDNRLYPPRCCGHAIPQETALWVLSFEEQRAYYSQIRRYEAKKRVYCAAPTCSQLIPRFAIEDDHGTCPACRRKTHLRCLSLEHPAGECPKDKNLKQALDIGDSASWQRCFHCHMMVERPHGCDDITCR